MLVCILICLFIYLFVFCLFIRSFIYLFIYLFTYLFIRSFIYLFVHLFIYLFVCFFVCLFISVFVHLFVCLFIYLFIYLFIRLFVLSLIRSTNVWIRVLHSSLLFNIFVWFKKIACFVYPLCFYTCICFTSEKETMNGRSILFFYLDFILSVSSTTPIIFFTFARNHQNMLIAQILSHWFGFGFMAYQPLLVI